MNISSISGGAAPSVHYSPAASSTNTQPAASEKNSVISQTSSSSFSAHAISTQFTQDSQLVSMMRQLTPLELAGLILNMLLGHKKEEEKDNQTLMTLGLASLMAQNRTQSSSLYSSTTNHSTTIVDKLQVDAAYGHNQQLPAQAVDPSATTQTSAATSLNTTPAIDTLA